MTVLGGVSDISTATYGCHSNLGTNLDGVGWGCRWMLQDGE